MDVDRTQQVVNIIQSYPHSISVKQLMNDLGPNVGEYEIKEIIRALNIRGIIGFDIDWKLFYLNKRVGN
jgi:hypothetical protein